MTRNLLGGTALIAILSVTPAVAQDDMRALMFADEAQMNARVAEMDTDKDGSISMDEYNAYLVAVPVAEADRETYVADFEALDTDSDGILIVTELEAGMATDGAEGTAAKVDVTQPEAQVSVTQPAADVNVQQGNATVAVSQPEPEVAVTQKEPEVSVNQAEPTVSVNQPEPEVSVEQGEATVAIEQPEAQVAVDAPAPEVEVRQATPDVQVTQKEPTVSVQQPEPEVSVETQEAEVAVTTEDPNVVIEQGEPEVVIQKVTSVDGTTEAAETDTDTAMENAAESTGTAMETAAATTAAATTATVNAVAFDDLDGEDAYNNMDQEIGEITDIVMEKTTGDIYVVVSAGGFLGLGDADVVFPYERVSVAGDKVMIDTNMSEENLEDRNDYQEDLYEDVPEDMIVR